MKVYKYISYQYSIEIFAPIGVYHLLVIGFQFSFSLRVLKKPTK